MKLFDDDGHLRKESFSLLISDNGDELQRLEISEHLSFCDDCLTKYLDVLSEEDFIMPLHSQTKNIQEAGRRLGMSLFYRRFTVVAAAFLALFLWSAGVFNWQSDWIAKNPAEKIQAGTQAIAQQTSELGERINEKYSRALFRMWEWRMQEEQKIIEKEINGNGEK